MLFDNIYSGKTVLVTGHTGFKGSWLCQWLLRLGATVVGVALPPNTEPSLFEQLGLSDRIQNNYLDIRNHEEVEQLIVNSEPDYIFHLAAQPLVRLSYSEPVETYETNVLGTVNILSSLKKLQELYRRYQNKYCAVICITTDKCYENKEWIYSYREIDALGGYDPYSSSKACAEMAISSFRNSFFNHNITGNSIKIGIASARAGNVIGGGDWAADRIIPDCIRYLQNKAIIPVRNKNATRPWQHVLEPLAGYLLLAKHQYESLVKNDTERLDRLCSAFNFGPEINSNRTVENLIDDVFKYWPGQWEDKSVSNQLHEAGKLNLAWDKAFHTLNWKPVWGFDITIQKTIEWYSKQINSNDDPVKLTNNDIDAYEQSLTI